MVIVYGVDYQLNCVNIIYEIMIYLNSLGSC